MTVSRVDQLIITASPGDAITSMALTIREHLRSSVKSDLFALTVLPSLSSEVLPLHRLGPDVPTSALVYHASFGEPEVTNLLRKRRQQIAMIFHNITPPEYFEAHSARFATGLLWGMHELSELKDRWSVVIADSEFNASVLRDQGYSDVHTAPLGVRTDRLSDLPTNLTLARELHGRFPEGFLVSIGQQLPHKRVESAVMTLHLLHEVHGRRLGLVVVGPERLPHYSGALRSLARRLHLDDHVHFAGAVDDVDLVTYLRESESLLMTSDHEGFGIPPLEAMQELVPVIAKGVGAVPSTVGDAGIVLPVDAGPCHFAEAVVRLLSDDILRDHLVLAGLTQVTRFSSTDRSHEVAVLLQDAFR